MNVLFIQHHPSPYRDPVLLRLKQENVASIRQCKDKCVLFLLTYYGE